MIKVGILGAAGYTGGELIRLLLNHSEAEIVFANSESNAGNLVSDVHEGLIGETDLKFTDDMPFDQVDVIFFCFGHGKSEAFLKEHTIPANVKIIDLAQDFRIKGSQESGVRSQESGVRSQESGDGSQETGDGSQETGDRSLETGDRSQETGVIHFRAESDALIVKGIVALLIRVLSGHTAQEILDADLYFIEEIGLKEHLSPTRSNGLVAMVKQMRSYALAFSLKR